MSWSTSWCPSTPATSLPGGCACTGAASTAGSRRGRASPSSSTGYGPWRGPWAGWWGQGQQSAGWWGQGQQSAGWRGQGRQSRRSPDVAELAFDCTGARVDRYAVVPSLSLILRISETSGQRVEAIALRCQIRIEPARRRYSAAEAERLNDLFGDTERWADTLKPMQFSTVATMVPGFSGATEVDLPVPFTYDLEVGSARYFDSLEAG